MKNHARHLSWIVVMAALLAVAGCGGGGGEGDVLEDEIEEGADAADLDVTDRPEAEGVPDGVPDQDAVEDQADGDGPELKPNGETCAAGDECESTSCVDGVCCGEADCPGECNVCNAPGSLGTCSTAPDGRDCDDAVFCNGTDHCESGACSVHDGDPCPGPDGDDNCSETCDESAGACTGSDPDDSDCNDGLFCTGADKCQDGTCSVHDGDPCPGPDGDDNCAESCNETDGDCTGNDPDDSDCDDGTFCNGPDHCQDGSCSAHDGDPCPGPDGDDNCAESCSETDGDCTASDLDGSDCDDGTFCNGADQCQDGGCSVHPGDPCPGPDGDDNCSESCDESAGTCTASDPDGSSCDDTFYCTGTDTCLGGTCSVHSDLPCTPPESCDETTQTCFLDVWVNELHYDNDSTDADEGVEIAGPAGTDLAGWSIFVYNGSTGVLSTSTPNPLDLSGVIPDQQAGFGTLWFARAGIENGSPDGLALVDPAGTVVQFLSYEGTFAATAGPANGMTSVDIGVQEDPASAVGDSLQLQGTGYRYSQFTWAGSSPSTHDLVNTGQTFQFP